MRHKVYNRLTVSDTVQFWRLYDIQETQNSLEIYQRVSELCKDLKLLLVAQIVKWFVNFPLWPLLRIIFITQLQAWYKHIITVFLCDLVLTSLMLPVQNLNKHTMFHLQCDIALRNPVLQNKSTVVYMSTALYLVFFGTNCEFCNVNIIESYCFV